MKNIIVMTLLLVSFCSRTEDIDELSANKAKWENKKIVNYEFTLRINCFCTRERVGPHLIKIVNNEIESVNGLPYNPEITGELYTVDELFTFVQTSMEREPYLKTINYNPLFGYPEEVYFDFNKSMADEEIGYEVADFKVI